MCGLESMCIGDERKRKDYLKGNHYCVIRLFRLQKEKNKNGVVHIYFFFHSYA